MAKTLNDSYEGFGRTGNLVAKISFFAIAPFAVGGYEFYNRIRDLVRNNENDPQGETSIKGKVQHIFNSTRAYQVCRQFKVPKNTCKIVYNKYRKVIPSLFYNGKHSQNS